MSSQDKDRSAAAREMPAHFDRDERERLLQLAFAEVLLLRMRDTTLSRTLVARTAGISRSYLQSLLAAKKQPSLVVFWALAQASGTGSGGFHPPYEEVPCAPETVPTLLWTGRMLADVPDGSIHADEFGGGERKPPLC